MYWHAHYKNSPKTPITQVVFHARSPELLKSETSFQPAISNIHWIQKVNSHNEFTGAYDDYRTKSGVTRLLVVILWTFSQRMFSSNHVEEIQKTILFASSRLSSRVKNYIEKTLFKISKIEKKKVFCYSNQHIKVSLDEQMGFSEREKKNANRPSYYVKYPIFPLVCFPHREFHRVYNSHAERRLVFFFILIQKFSDFCYLLKSGRKTCGNLRAFISFPVFQLGRRTKGLPIPGASRRIC